MSDLPPSPGDRSGNRSPAAGSLSTGPEVAERPSSFARFLAYRSLWILAVLVFVGDRLSKNWIQANLPYGANARNGGIEVIPDFLYLIHVGNTGGAWSIFSGRSTLLGIIGLSVLLAVFLWRRQLALRESIPQLCFGLFIGGSVGNILDRFQLGYVTDFLDFHFGSYIYPTFNVADSAICVGVVGYVLWSFRQPAPPESNK